MPAYVSHFRKMTSLTGKIALITGGAQGLGKAYSEALLKNGAKVCVVDINGTVGNETLSEFSQTYGKESVKFIKCDVTSQQEMENAFTFTKSTFGGLDIVCNNAGLADEHQWDRMIQINLIGVVRGTMLGIEHMSKDKGGRGGIVINISSVAGLGTNHFFPAYVAAKTGVVALTRSWAKNLSCEKMGLQFRALCPDFVQTELFQYALTHCYDPANLKKKRQTAMRPETVADAFLQLIQCEGSNGEVMLVTLEGTRLIPEVDQLSPPRTSTQLK